MAHQATTEGLCDGVGGVSFMYPIPILSPFLFIYYICFFKFTGFLIYLSALIFIYYYVYLCEREQAPIKINNKEKCLFSSWKLFNTHAYQVSSPCVLLLAVLRVKK